MLMGRIAIATGREQAVAHHAAVIAVEEDTELVDIAASDQEHQRFVRLRHFTGKNCHFLKRLPDLIRVIRG